MTIYGLSQSINSQLQSAMWSSRVVYSANYCQLCGRLHLANPILPVSTRYSIVFAFLYPFRLRKHLRFCLNRDFFLKSVNRVKGVKGKKENLKSQYTSVILQLTDWWNLWKAKVNYKTRMNQNQFWFRLLQLIVRKWNSLNRIWKSFNVQLPIFAPMIKHNQR